MAHPAHPISIDLPKAGMLRLADMSGVELHCLSGTLWLTLDNDPRDVVLEAGDRFVTASRRPAIVYALATASARLLAPSAVVPQAAGAGQRAGHWLRWLQWLRASLPFQANDRTPSPT